MTADDKNKHYPSITFLIFVDAKREKVIQMKKLLLILSLIFNIFNILYSFENDNDKRLPLLNHTDLVQEDSRDQFAYPNVQENIIRIIVDDHQRQITLLLQHEFMKPFVALIQYGSFAFVCDERRIYITSLRSHIYNQLGIYGEYKVIFEEYGPDLTDMVFEPQSQRLFFLNERGEIRFFYLCPQIRYGGMIIAVDDNGRRRQSMHYLFIDTIHRKLLWGDHNQIWRCDFDGQHLETFHKFSFVTITSHKMDSWPMDMDGDCLYWNVRRNLYKLSYNGQINLLLNDPRFVTNQIKVVDDGRLVYFISMGRTLYRIDLSNEKPKFEKITEITNKSYFINLFNVNDLQHQEEWCQIHEEEKSIWEEMNEYGWWRSSKKNLASLILNILFIVILIIIFVIIGTVCFVKPAYVKRMCPDCYQEAKNGKYEKDELECKNNNETIESSASTLSKQPPSIGIISNSNQISSNDNNFKTLKSIQL